MRDAPVQLGDRRFLGTELRCVVVGAKQGGQRLGEFGCAASPCLTVDGVGDDRVIRAVTGPLRIRLVRQIAPSGAS